MVDDNDILSRADSLMRPEGERAYASGPPGGNRRRRFVAIASPAAERRAEASTGQTSDDDDDDDWPVLTEVVAPEAAVSEAVPNQFDETLLSIIAADLVHTIEQELANALPPLIEAALITAQDELRTGIATTLEVALRDFLARRQQLRLSLDEPDAGH